jgi:hypothetical protein
MNILPVSSLLITALSVIPVAAPAAEPVTDRIAAQIEFDFFFGKQDYFHVSNFALNTSELCPTGNCEFNLDDGQMFPPGGGDRAMSGKLRIDDGESTKIMNLNANWQPIEEREGEDGETIQIIVGTIGIGREQFNPDFEYRINGILTSDESNYIVALQGER